MEKPTFYDQLRDLREHFGDVAFIGIADAAKYVGAHRQTLLGDRTFPVRKFGNQYRINVIQLARWLAG